ncbi:MAG: hypothetical protein ACK5V3_04835 [Bdellovibrionales bacterium]
MKKSMAAKNESTLENNQNEIRIQAQGESSKAVTKNIKLVKVQPSQIKARGPRDCFPLG